jgi:hypothetical protein
LRSPRIGPTSGLPSGANVNGPQPHPGRADRRKVLEADFEARRDALEIVRQQVLAEVPGRLDRGPGHAGALVGSHQHPAAFLAQVDLALEVDRVQRLLPTGEFGEVSGDQVLMFHREDRQFQPDHPADLARPQTAGVDDVLGVHVAVIGDHVPGPVGARLQVHDPRAPHDLGARDLRRFRIRVRDPVGIDVTLDRIVERAREMLLVHQREELRGLVDRDDLELHPEVPTARLRHLQPVEPFAGAREHDPAGDVHAAGLSGDALDLLVELDRVLLQLGDVRVAVHGVHAARRMPGRTGGELRALDQQHVLPAGLGQVIQNARTDDSAADHDHTCVAPHVLSQVLETARCSFDAVCSVCAALPNRWISQERNSAIAVSLKPSGCVIR